MTRLEKQIEALGFNEIAKENGWTVAAVNNESKRAGFMNLSDNSYLTVFFSRYLLNITRITWWNRPSAILNVWEPHHSEEHISISRIKHILRGTISPTTKT